ncbi:MAG: hypothetical protein EOP51_21920, partial [Sphingobacteriales bacterium]
MTANKTYYVEATLGTCASPTRTAVNLTVNPEIVFSTTTLANANPSGNYSRQITAATGGTAPYTYAVSGQTTLPAGITLTTSGQLSGIPATAGDYTFSVTVTDARSCTATANFTLKVTDRLTLASKLLPNGIVGSVYIAQEIPAATGGTGPYTYVASSLPPGLSFENTTRQITGTPTNAGTYTFPIVVTDADGYTITTNYTIVVDPALALPTAPLVDGTVGVPYQTQTILAASGGRMPFTYGATGLPPGLSFDAATRQIGGTPTIIGSYPIVVTATDSLGRSITANYNINVLNPLALPDKVLANGTVNVAYTPEILPAATGGSGTFTYTTSTLPAGLTFDATTRTIAGTPTQAGNYNITLTANDGNGRTISKVYALTVIGALTLPSATLPDGTVNTPYPTQTLPAVTGGTGPYTYVASNLPPGLSFNVNTREITGTPTQGGSYTISVVATDAVGNNVRTDYTINVNVSLPVVANTITCSGSTAILNVTNLQPGVTYNWYGSTGNTALATNNTGTFTTPSVTSTTTFYVEAVSGTAASARVAVNVTANPLPAAPAVTSPNVVVSTGQSATLQATVSGTSTINWYDAPTGGNLLFTGATYTTSALNATTIFYAGNTNAEGCASATRTPVTVTVLNNGTSPNCTFANAQTTAINGICVLCDIIDAGNSTDADLDNFTTIRLGVGIGAVGFQRLSFPNAGIATDSVRLDLALPTGLVDATVLGGITVNVLNGATLVRTVQLNSGLLNLRLLGGGRFQATFLPGQAFDRVEVRFGGVATVLSSLNIYGAQIVYPRPTVAATGLNICSGATASLSATPNGGTSLAWFSSASGGSALATGNTFTTPTLTATTTYYIEITRAGCTSLDRVPVTVNVTPALTAPAVANAGPVCDGATATVSITSPDATVTYNWYEVANGGTPIFTGTTFTSPALTANKTYYVEATLGTCASPTRTAVNLTVNP